MSDLLCVGQIKEGDSLLCEHKGEPLELTAEEILHPGTEAEEIIVDRKRNKYFITVMAIGGSSWAKNVKVLNT